jgi:phage gp29-like protein
LEVGLQDGDVAEPQQGQPEQRFKALSNRPFSFAASVKNLTQEQQELDELAEPEMQLFSDAIIKDLIKNSTGIDDLRAKLFDLAHDVDTTQFNELMDRALFAADILGYVHSKEGR